MTLKQHYGLSKNGSKKDYNQRVIVLGFPIFSSKGNSTPIGLDENGQDSMLDAP